MINAPHWHRIWSARGPWACVLWPLSALYWVALNLRALLYRLGLLTATRLRVPVVVVGNVYVGGVGKTPITIELVRQLTLAGWRPGILSRGHGRAGVDICLVQDNSTAAEVGDEPLLMHHAAGCPVAVGAHRAQAGQLLLAQHPEVNVLVCDDGLQHLALHHDVALCVFDSRRIGNGWLLPAGPLREPWPGRFGRLGRERSRLWVLSSEQPAWDQAWPVMRQLSAQAVNGHGERIALHQLPRPLNALAGIAQPERFFQDLRDMGLTLEHTLARPDHDALQDWHPAEPGHWVCTEKDAVKIWPEHPEVWAVQLQVQLPQALLGEIHQALQTGLSSPHGHQTA